jgi:penicillin-binding protein 2
MYSGSGSRGEKLSTFKLTVVQYGILAMMLVLVSGLWRLQVLGAENFRLLAEQNRVRKVPLMAGRGKLFDRENRLIVDNYPSVSCFLVREQNRNVDADLPLIAKGLDLDLEQLRSTLRRYRAAPGYQPIPIKQDVTADETAFIEAHRNELPELETIKEERRLYPRDGFAAHLIGYVGEVSEEDLNNPRYVYNNPGDMVGKAGVEETYDQLLRGQDGSRDVVVDSHGREVGYLGIQHAKPGQDLKLTIDIDLQRTAELALGDANGAVVAMDPRNGEILALVSHPSYDPNAFAVRINRKDWSDLVNNPNHPLMNKAIQDQLAPGSTFKIIMSAAGLQEGVAQDMHVNCVGGGTFYGRFFHCDHHHGVLNISQAIPLSCDTFFYTLAQKLGIDTIAKYATDFGLGQKTGIDLPNEMAGVMPSTQWEMKNFHQRYYPGNTISVGIGQGETQVTPLQLARTLGGIASDGHFVRPHVVMPDQNIPADFRQAVQESFPGSGDKEVPLNPDTWTIITDGMAAATTTGTAAAAHIEGVDFAGKTGTAQVVGGGDTHVKGGEKTPNSWFVGMVPRRNPEIVICVLQEHGDWGSNSAHIAQAMIVEYVNKQRMKDQNVTNQASLGKPVEMGAIWSDPLPAGWRRHGVASLPGQDSQLHAGHFMVDPGPLPGLKAMAGGQFVLPKWLLALPLRFKEGQP